MISLGRASLRRWRLGGFTGSEASLVMDEHYHY
jgi:hypothetical protein